MGFSINDFKKVFTVLREAMQENKDYLIKLDSKMGDGDLGLTMSKGFTAASDAINDFEGEDIGKALLKVAMSMNSAASSTMGTLISSGFMRAGKSAKGKEKVEKNDLVKIAEEILEGIQDRGKAKKGDKTILDSLIPAVEAFKEKINTDVSLKKAIEASYKASEKGVEKTKEMVSEHGRAAYYGEKSRGNQDPGATVVLVALKAINEYMEE